MATNFIQQGEVVSVTLASMTSGAPAVFGQLPGVCLTATDGDGKVRLATKGVFDLSVKGIDGSGNAAVTAGDKIYYTSGDTPKLNKKTTGVPFGIALEAVASAGTDTINVLITTF